MGGRGSACNALISEIIELSLYGAYGLDASPAEEVEAANANP
jgi:hypothetical protein